MRVDAQSDTSVQQKPELLPGWILWIPCATHFHDRHIATGLLFSVTEIGGISIGIILNKKLNPQSSTAYYNFSLLLGMQAFNIVKCDFVRHQL